MSQSRKRSFMKHFHDIPKQYALSYHLHTLPRKMVQLHGQENVADFVMHELCSSSCFNLTKAALFIDNPDFDWFKGITGFHKHESCQLTDIWQESKNFTKHMEQSAFHQQVRSIHRPSTSHNINSIVDDIVTIIDLQNPVCCTWQMRHDNTGILIYEQPEEKIESHDMLNGLSLFAFCPIY
jgi:hypothetical protein